MNELFQIYDTDQWGTHASRTNYGVFTSVENALKGLFDSKSHLREIFAEDNRLWIEKISIDKKEGYTQVFDSDFDKDMMLLKKILFFESIERFKQDLYSLSYDENDTGFDINAVQSVDDVTDEMIETFLTEKKDIKNFLNIFFEE